MLLLVIEEYMKDIATLWLVLVLLALAGVAKTVRH